MMLIMICWHQQFIFYKQRVNVFTNNDIKYVFINIIGRGENTLWMGQLGQFHYMCVNYTPTKCVAFNFGFQLWCLGFIFLTFIKLILFNIIWKEKINLKD